MGVRPALHTTGGGCEAHKEKLPFFNALKSILRKQKFPGLLVLPTGGDLKKKQRKGKEMESKYLPGSLSR